MLHMMHRNMNRLAIIPVLLAGILGLAGCQTDEVSNPVRKSTSDSSLLARGQQIDPATTQTLWGPSVPVGNGTGSAWVKVNRAGVPIAIGVDLSEEALENLPMDPTEWVLMLPNQVKVEPYNHIGLEYNPLGHEPPGVYDLPHFDFHFYMITEGERGAIGPNDPRFDIEPNLIYIPDHYMRIPGGVPGMGAHWIDLLAPEHNGGVFTRTFIWGSFDGKVVFFEPMVTVSALMSDMYVDIPTRQPQAFQRDGYYPRGYSTAHLENPGRYRVALEALRFRTSDTEGVRAQLK